MKTAFDILSGDIGKLYTKIYKLLVKELKELEAEMVDLNTDSQLFVLGIDSNGNKLPMPYAKRTIIYKKANGQPINRITLKDSGDFHDGFYITYKNNYFEFWSKDDKAKILTQEWGEDIFGLTDKNIEKVIEEYLMPVIMNFLLNEFK